MALIDFVFTRSGEATRMAQNGLLATVPANFPVVNFAGGELLGYYSQRAATNHIRNNTMQGAVVGSPGTLPTNWNESLRGLTREIVATGTENGVNYIDVRFHGTANTTASLIFNAEAITTIVASNGQTWTSSIYLKNILSTLPPLNIRLGIEPRLENGNFLTGGGITDIEINANLFRYRHTVTLNNASTERVSTSLFAGVTSGQSYDFTIRIGLPQMEQSAVATSVIKTTTTTVTRPADIATASGLTLSPLSNVQFKANFPTDYPLVIAGLQATVSGYRTIRLELSPTVKTLFVDGVEQDTATGSYDWSGITSIELGHFDGGEQPNFEIADLRINE
jgi:hypothetical protein